MVFWGEMWLLFDYVWFFSENHVKLEMKKNSDIGGWIFII
jgi:hypothetical protein